MSETGTGIVADRAPVDVLDGIVVVELSLDVRHEISDLVACIRAGAAAWAECPARGIDPAFRPADVGRVLDVAQEIEDEARRVHDAREAAHRQRSKAAEKEARRRTREAKR